MNYIKPSDNNKGQLETKRKPRRRAKDSIWCTEQGQWRYKNLAGTITRAKSEEQARHIRNNWTPNFSRLVRDGVLKVGDPISLKFHGIDRVFELKLAGLNRQTPSYLIAGKPRSFLEIRKQLADKLGRPFTGIGLNYDQTIHQPSGKSIRQHKKEYVAHARQKITNTQSDDNKSQNLFDFLNVLDFEKDRDIKEIKLQNDIKNIHLSDLRADIKKYENAQFDILSTMQTLSEETVMDCYRDSLIMFLENTKTRE